MSAKFVEIILLGGAVGVLTVFLTHLVGRKLRSEKPLDPEIRRRDLRTW